MPPPGTPTLEDPLFSLRLFLRWSAFALFGLTFLTVLVALTSVSERVLNTGPLIPILFVAVLLTIWWCLQVVLITAFIPARRTNALYLRSFRHDEGTWPIRVAIQEALGARFRLSGIRNPNRRESAAVDVLMPVIFAMRYCTPKFMDLEAGVDWKSRLWSSMQQGKCVFIDVSDLTRFVREEIELANRCVGFERVVFVVHGAVNEQQAREEITQLLEGVPDPSQIRIMTWLESDSGYRSFITAIMQFREQLKNRNRSPLQNWRS